MHGKTAYGGLDSFRIAAAFLVVAIHTSPLGSLSPEGDFFLTRILARVAVPFFFLVTGHFVLGEFQNDSAGGVPFSRIKKYLRKVAGLYALSILLYIPVGLYAGHYRHLGPLDMLRLLVFDGTFYHLWYFPACMLGVVLVWLLCQRLSLGAVSGIATVLYVLGLFGDSYYGLIAPLPVVSGLYDGLFHIFTYTRNGLFFAPLFLVMGIYCSRDFSTQKSHKRKATASLMRKPQNSRRGNLTFLITGLLLSLALLTAEGFLLKYYDLQRHDSMYFFLVPCMYFLYRLLLSLKLKPKVWLRRVSTGIYILHPAIIVGIRGAARAFGLTRLLVDSSLIHFVTVCLVSLAASVFLAIAADYTRKKPCPTGRAWLELDRKALEDNVAALKAALPKDCKLMPALKANAYGHGSVIIARELNRLGVKDFCVASVSEGVALRQGGIRGNILILGYTHPEDFYLLRRHRLMQTVIDFSYAAQLNRYGKKLAVHIAIDTGMHRLGVPASHIEELCLISRMERLKVKGIFTHLCASDGTGSRDKNFTNSQAQLFYETVEKLRQRGIPCPGLHLLASYGVRGYAQYAEDYARVGIALYGIFSTHEEDTLPLRPVLSLKARVATVKELALGESAGYGLAFTATRPTRLAVLSIGYGDGFPRALSCGKGQVLIRGQRVPVIGRVCMDQTLVDVTDIPFLRSGDEAVLIGASGQEEISVCDLADQCGTITNEILSRLGSRLTRVLR